MMYQSPRMLPAFAKTVFVGTVDVGSFMGITKRGSKKGGEVYSSRSLNAKRARGKGTKPRAALLIMASMESPHPLDHLIATADRALRALFAPAHASRPVPDAEGPVAVEPTASAGAA